MSDETDDAELVKKLWDRALEKSAKFGRDYRLLANGVVVRRDSWLERDSDPNVPATRATGT
jgi:hypothetical protein